jgi:hypothetical protein
MMTYADAHNSLLPPHVALDKDGKPLYSWRVLLLPYLGETALYQKLKLDEAWDSPHNAPLLANMPKVFHMSSGNLRGNMTAFTVFTGEGTPFPPGKQGVRLPQGFPDGTSNTILIVETMLPVHWASPGDIYVAPEVELKRRVGTRSNGGTLAAFADGTVRILPKTITEELLRAYVTPAGGERVSPP